MSCRRKGGGGGQQRRPLVTFATPHHIRGSGILILSLQSLTGLFLCFRRALAESHAGILLSSPVPGSGWRHHPRVCGTRPARNTLSSRWILSSRAPCACRAAIRLYAPVQLAELRLPHGRAQPAAVASLPAVRGAMINLQLSVRAW